MSLRFATAAAIAIATVAACERSEPVGDELFTEVWQDPEVIGSCGGDPAMQQAMVDATNQLRATQEKTVLEVDDRLVRIAQSHACDIAARQQPSVAGADGSNIVDRARSVDFPTCGVAQLVAVGSGAQEVTQRWMQSDPHRVELLGQDPDKIGAGAARGPDGRIWWSLVLGDDCR